MNKGSLFTSKWGIAFLAVMAFIAAYNGFVLAQTVFVILLIIVILAPLAAKLALSKLEIGNFGSSVSAFPGQSSEIVLSAENNKLLPVTWLEMVLPTENTCLEASDESGELKTAVSWIMPFQKISCSQKIVALKRGVYQTDGIILRTGDFFGLAVAEKQCASVLPAITVYPKIVPVNTEPVLRNMSELEQSKNGFYVDRTLLNSVRPYADGAQYKDINQRLLAREDKMYVNVYEKLAMRRVCFVPDFEKYVTRTMESGPSGSYETVSMDEDGFENMLSEIASLVIELSKKDVICTLVLPSYGNRQHKIIIPESTEYQIPQLLSALAGIDYHGERTKLPTQDMESEAHLLGHIINYTCEKEII